MFGEVLLLGKILEVMQATNLISERPFFALKRIESHLSPSITNNSVDHMMILHVHKDKFESRKQIFWKINGF